MSTDDLQTVAWLIEGSRVFVDSVAMTEESARKRIAERGKDSATTAPLVRRSAALSCIEALERERDAALANLDAALSLHNKTKAERDAALADARRYRVLRDDQGIAREVVSAAFGGDTDDTTDWSRSLDEWCNATIAVQGGAAA